MALARVALGIPLMHMAYGALIQAILAFGTLLMLLAVVSFYALYGTHSGLLLWVSAIMIIGSVSIVFGWYTTPAMVGKINHFFGKNSDMAIPGALKSCERVKKIAMMCALSAAISVVRSTRLLLIVLVASEEAISPTVVLSLVLASDAAAQVPVTPAGIGVREAVFSYLGAEIGLFEIFLSSALFDRALAILFNLIHGLHCLKKIGTAGVGGAQ